MLLFVNEFPFTKTLLHPYIIISFVNPSLYTVRSRYVFMPVRPSYETRCGTMTKNFDNYSIENLQVPTLVFHAKDDKLTNYEDTINAINRFPNCTFIPFETGGHLMVGHEKEIKEVVFTFTKNNCTDYIITGG